MISFNEYIVRHDRVRRTTQAARRQVREDIGEVRTISSFGLDAATIALPAEIDLDDRAARMEAFWRALVGFQHRGVIVVALCAVDEL